MTTILVTVIGDLVGSRRSPDRALLQKALGAALDLVNSTLSPAQAFEPTVADEFQGACSSLPDAVLAALLVRLSLLPDSDVRCGIGRGEVTVHDATHTPLLQDGPGWWSARAAIEAVDASRDGRRSWYVGEGDDATNAYLLCRDQLVRRLNDRGIRMLRLALLGHSQQEIAALEQVWPSAVSQQFTRGIGTLLESQRLFGRTSDRTSDRHTGASR